MDINATIKELQAIKAHYELGLAKTEKLLHSMSKIAEEEAPAGVSTRGRKSSVNNAAVASVIAKRLAHYDRKQYEHDSAC